MFPRLTDNNDSGGSPAVFCDVKFAVGQVIRYPAFVRIRIQQEFPEGGRTGATRPSPAL